MSSVQSEYCLVSRGGGGRGEYHISLIFLLGFLLVSSEGIKDLISGLTDGDGSHLSPVIDPGSEGVDLADCEPGQGGEHEVEQVLTDVDHDVVILEDALFDDITKNNCKSGLIIVRIFLNLPVPGPPIAQTGKEALGCVKYSLGNPVVFILCPLI